MNDSGITHRRVQVDKDGARDVFAAAGLSEESVIRTGIASILSNLCIDGSIMFETVLEEVTVCLALLLDFAQQFEVIDDATEGKNGGEDVQLPSTVTQLSTSLADVKMANLE